MDYRASFAISATGMAIEKTRLDIAALNLANLHSSVAPGGQNYRPLSVVAHPSSVDFSELMRLGETPARSFSIAPLNTRERLVHEPGHPHADAQGFVRYPGVDQATEMVNALTAVRAYEANVAAVGFARTMASRALDIGGHQ